MKTERIPFEKQIRNTCKRLLAHACEGPYGKKVVILGGSSSAGNGEPREDYYYFSNAVRAMIIRGLVKLDLISKQCVRNDKRMNDFHTEVAGPPKERASLRMFIVLEDERTLKTFGRKSPAANLPQWMVFTNSRHYGEMTSLPTPSFQQALKVIAKHIADASDPHVLYVLVTRRLLTKVKA